ncbi:MAG TPA: DegT/DnrJ/EryC1/StrS family aminotransferase [Chthoniobacterales bacterium]
MIPWAKPTLFGREDEYVRDALASTWISGGPYVETLEEKFRSLLDVPFASVTSNGTTALHLAYLALDIRPGDEIILPGFAYMGAANIALLCGARPIFVDVDPATWCIAPGAIEKAISKKTKAIVPIHTYGNVCDLSGILELAASHDVAVIEDAAECLGSQWKGQPAGTLGTMGTYSFHATKTITTGEGGMVVTRDPTLAERLRLYRSHGMLRQQRYYWHEVPGHNFRLTNMQAAMGCAQLEKFDAIMAARRTVHQRYGQRFQGEHGLVPQFFAREVSPILWTMALKLDPSAFPQGRDEVIAEMRGAGIECRPGFYTPSQQPIYDSPALPQAEELARQVISLPTFPDLKEEEIDFISQTLLSFRR